MDSILIRRDQFNITPQGITHKPTNSQFTPPAGDPSSGTISLGQLGTVVFIGEQYDADQVKKVMMQLWVEYVAANSDLFSTNERVSGRPKPTSGESGHAKKVAGCLNRPLQR